MVVGGRRGSPSLYVHRRMDQKLDLEHYHTCGPPEAEIL